MRMRWLLHIVVLKLSLLSLAPAVLSQTTPTQQFRLNKIEVEGLRKVDKEKVVEACGLKIGQDVDMGALKAAANRLHDSGWFTQVTYRYNFAEGQMDVTFEVEEKVLSAGPAKLGEIEFLGLKQVQRDLALKESGLQPGQLVDRDTIEAASKRLMDTGYFLRGTFQYQQLTEQIKVTFEMTERRWDVPCVFDNFVWFTDQELVEIICRDVPPFNGSAPETGGVPERVTKILSGLIQQRGLTGQISHSFLSGGQNGAHVFSVIGVPLPVCSVELTGASVTAAPQLLKAVKPLIGKQYSRSSLTVSIETDLMPYYRQRGFLRAGFGQAQVKSSDGSDKKCKNGVMVNLPVTEGAAYVWDKAEWTGNQALTTAALDAALEMKSGAVADGQKIQSGLYAIKQAYSKQGFIEAGLTGAPSFDDANHRVSYRIVVKEGQQYRMGQLMITGLPEKETGKMQERWKLKSGDVFDASYPNEFVGKLIRDGAKKAPGVTPTHDRAKLTVDVMLNF
jgi:outer membrane protein assembly factor BamA